MIRFLHKIIKVCTRPTRLTIAFLCVFSALACSVFSSQSTYATAYPVEGIYWSFPIDGANDSRSSLPYFGVGSPEPITLDDYWLSLHNLLISSPDLNDVCQYQGMYNLIDLTGTFMTYRLPYSPNNAISRCLTLEPFNDTDHKLNVDSIPNNPLADWINYGYQSDRDYYVQILQPYWYTSNGFKTTITSSNGLVRRTNLTGDVLPFTNGTTPLNQLILPVYDSSLDSDCLEPQAGSNKEYQIDARFYLGRSENFHDYSEDVYDLDTTITVWYYGNGSSEVIEFPLNYSFTTDPSGDVFLNFTGTFSYNAIRLGTYGHVAVLLTYSAINQDYTPTTWFSSSTIAIDMIQISNSFESKADCSVGTHIAGNGAVGEFPSDSGNGNWLSDLTSLFSFNIINPLSPIFALFTNQTSCAHIPTLAGMLSSPQDTVCPWFSTEVRQIVTPVLGLFTTLLVFGFVVRWLSSSSGNYSDDSRSDR